MLTGSPEPLWTCLKDSASGTGCIWQYGKQAFGSKNIFWRPNLAKMSQADRHEFHVPRPCRISPLLRQWKPVSQQRAEKGSLGIWQISGRPGSKHLLGPVYNLKQQAAFCPVEAQGRPSKGSQPRRARGGRLQSLALSWSSAWSSSSSLKFSGHETGNWRIHFPLVCKSYRKCQKF